MRDETKSSLDKLFIQHADSKRRTAEAHDAKASAEVAFLREFLAARTSVVEPAMKEIGEYLRGKGYDYEITSKEDGVDRESVHRDIPASVTLTIYPEKKGHSPLGWPHLSVICNKREQKVWFHESTISPSHGGHSGGSGEAKLSELTAELVQEKILKVAAAVFR